MTAESDVIRSLGYLRELSRCIDEWEQDPACLCCDWAVQEIERLRKEVNSWSYVYDEIAKELDAANAALASLSEGYKSLQEQHAKTLERLNKWINVATDMAEERDEAIKAAKSIFESCAEDAGYKKQMVAEYPWLVDVDKQCD